MFIFIYPWIVIYSTFPSLPSIASWTAFRLSKEVVNWEYIQDSNSSPFSILSLIMFA